MKTLKYFFLPVLLLLFLTVSSFNGNGDGHSIMVGAKDKNISSAVLARSAEIIESRLNSLGAGKSEIKIIEKEKQIRITLPDEWDLPVVTRLVEDKGKAAFYLTYDREQLQGLLGGDNRLFTILAKNPADGSGSVIGCVQPPDTGKINDYLNSLAVKGKIKFAWSHDPGKSGICLYALKLSGEKGAVVSSEDIESAGYDQDRIRIKLRPGAAGVFAAATKQNLDRSMAVVLDDHVIAAPMIRSEIAGGEIEISGDFTKQEAGYISAIINSGPLPADFEVIR